ncbi:hypothetical protein B0J14DRAFT_557923 [Halenospora varia]|nr:hypothetical protein B0J14DRAFT_557923 [Halenospora varia]
MAIDYFKPPPSEEQLSFKSSILVTDFDEYTFRAPRPGLFLGDESRTPSGELNPITQFRLEAFEGDDLCSVVAFRSVNQRSRAIVDSLQSFQDVTSFPKLLGAALLIKASFFTLDQLAQCISNPKCTFCDHFGDLLYLITAERWCYACWRGNHTLDVQHVPRTIPVLGPITRSQHAHCRFGGPPILPEMECSDPSPETLELNALRDHGHIPHVYLPVGYIGARAISYQTWPRLAFDQRAFYDRDEEDKPNPRWLLEKTPSTILNYDPDPLRYAALIRAPYFDNLTQSWEEGFLCRACAAQGSTFQKWNAYVAMRGLRFPAWGIPWRRYTRRGFREHILEFGNIFKVKVEGGEFSEERVVERYANWGENPAELVRICYLSKGLREGTLEFPSGQPFLHDWFVVSSDPGYPMGFV